VAETKDIRLTAQLFLAWLESNPGITASEAYRRLGRSPDDPWMNKVIDYLDWRGELPDTFRNG
jgi:hypothetical protein